MNIDIKKWIAVIVFYLALPLIVFGQGKAETETTSFTVAYSSKLFSGVDLNDVQVAIDMWSSDLESVVNKELNTNYKIKSVFFGEETDITAEANIDRLDLINIRALDFVKIRNTSLWKPMFSQADEEGSPEIPFVLLVRKASAFSGLDDLQGASLSFAENSQSYLIRIWLDNLLLQNNYDIHSNFFETKETGPKPSKSVLDLFFGKIDACVVDYEMYRTMAELNPQLGKTLHILFKSPPFMTNVVCVNNKLSPNLIKIILKEAQELHARPKGKQLLKLFGGKNVAEYKTKYLDNLIDLGNTNEELMKAYNQDH